MSRIGTIEEVLNNGETELWGFIRTLSYDFKFQLIKNPEQNGENSPAYLAYTKSPQNHLVEVGVAWKNKAKRYGADQSDFLSITFDDPSFDKRLNVVAFPQDDQKTWAITWRRRQDKTRNSEAA